MENTIQHSQIYIKENATRTDQRTGLNMLMTMSSQAKDGSPDNAPLHENVLNIADILLIMDLNCMPSAHLFATALKNYKHTSQISEDELRDIVSSLTATVFDDSTASPKSSPGKSTHASVAKSNATQSDSGSDSGDERSKQQVVSVKWTDEDDDRLLAKLRSKTHAVRGPPRVNDAELVAKLSERINKLTTEHLSSLVAYYCAQRSPDHHRHTQWNNQQARGAETLRLKIHSSFHRYLTLPAANGSLELAQIANIQGSLFLKCLIQNILDCGDNAIANQEAQVKIAIASYNTTTDFLAFSST